MNKTLTRLFTVALLMMVSMGARAEVKVLFGEKGTEKYEGKGGTIQVKQEESRDGGKVTVRLAFIPEKNYTFDEQSLEVYKVFSPESATARALEIDGDALKLEEDKSTNPSEKHYHVEIDSKLNLWVKVAQFISESKADPTRSDYSGTYYIGSVGYKEANTTTNYYLCPTEGWCYYQATDNFTGTDNGMPFLTTYQCRDGVYDVRKAIWTIEKAPAPNEAYYYIKQASTGRYLTSNGKINTTNNADRLRVHLEAVAQENLDGKELFKIESYNGHYVISPKDVVGGAADRNWLVVNGGNQNALTGQSGKGNGPTGYTNTAGIIGVYTKNDGSAPFYLEEAIMPPTFNINSDGSVELSSLEGTSIRYTTDGTTPTAGSIEYTAAIRVTSTMTSIKAIAIRTSDNKASDAVTLPLHTYTYYIVNKSGDIAIKQVVKQAEGKALGSMAADIPADIRSPYLIGEAVTFYSFDEAFTSAEQLTDEVKISATPQDDANIYVTYTTDHLSEKFLRLRGARAFNIVTNDGYAYDNNGSLAYDNVETNKTQPNYLWNISGGDPYAVQIDNLGTGRYLVSSTMPTLSLEATATNNFILMEESAATDAGFESVKLMKATGTGTLQETKEFQATPVNITTKYNLIDKAGKLIQGNIESESSELGLPAEWRSPLVSKYHYYSTSDRSGDTYSPTGEEITSPFEAGPDGNIYVTYDVSDAVDLTGGKTYLLKFSGGEYFHQEDGHDGINKEGYTDYGVTSATKAIYPYNNGDFNLYVYGQEQWEAQLASGASTRSRWLWYIISSHNGNPLTGNNIDPYHVVIKSYQNHTVKDKIDKNDVNSGDKNYGPGSSYLQTYKPSDYASVITNIAYENENYYSAYSEKMPTPIVNGQPTEYMILGTSLQNMTLKTFNEVEGERRTVNSFEQYWKNNPIVETLAGVANPAADNATLTEMGWHQFTAWAYSAPWDSNTKGLAEGKHWYQTISMGSGNFTVEEVSLTPQVILLDQHGWEIMRTPLTDVTTLRKYDSPMVEQYHWYPTAEKVSGYHKYRVSNQEITVYDSDRKATSGRFIHNSNTLAYTPYDYFETIKDENGWVTQDDRVKSDFYVTYTVKSEYDDAYTGAATSDAAVPSAYLLKQGGSYASTNGSAITATTAPASMEDIPNVMQWNLRPNFDIDREMGYKYAGETGAQDGAKSKEATDQDNYDEGRNGFDPYNVQIQSVAYPLRYFTANTEGIALDGGTWKGTSSTINLQNLSIKQTADGYDQTKLSITNATFMVVDDGAGNMRLMPRFDNSKVVTFSSSTPFKTLEAQTTAATAGDEGTGTQTLWLALVPKAQEVHSLSEITDMNGHYLLAQDFTFDSSSLGTSEHPFRGIIDGQLNTLSGTTSTPLVAYANGATIRNVILEEVGINETTGNVGAIACNAIGSTRIYNCGILSGTVKGTAYTGGLVGLLDGTSRVINCYSYADISGGTNAAGIVGYNNVSTTMTNLKTMVMNCMFYGNISDASAMKPVYGGNVISNAGTSGVNNYNYYRNGKDVTFDDNYTNFDAYYCTLPADEEYLTRFEYYRSILNSNKKLCTWWINGTSGTAPTDADVKAVGIAKWVLDPEIAPYPILKIWDKYPSVINQDKTQVWDPRTEDADGNPLTPHWVNRSSAPAYHGKQLGTISVTVNAGAKHAGTGITSTTLSSVIVMDMDTLNHDYCYAKIQLPYYNEVFGDPSIMIPATTADDYTEKWNQRYGGNYKDYVVTGWKITAVSEGTPGTFKGYAFASSGGVSAAAITPDDTSGNPWEDGFNFADRNCTNKDLYAKSGRVFAQGGYYYVPEGVTAITIEAYWGKAVYLHNKEHSLDRVNVASGADGAATAEFGTAFSPAGSLPTTFQDQTVQTTLQDAIDQLTKSASLTVYDQAIVLVGNVQVKNRSQSVGRDKTASNSRPFTIMSIDEDMDNEPDHCLELQFRQKTDRPTIHPVRFDFLPVPELGLAMRTNQNAYAIGVFIPQGHFEITETSFMHTTQFEYDGDAGRVESPIILNGGHFEQIVVRYGNKDKVSYFLLGGHFRIMRFTPGHHASNNSNATVRHCVVNAIGGDFPEFYLSGIYQPDLAVRADNPHCYINGGKFGTVAGAAYEQVNGDVTFKIDHAIIEKFYGGGMNGAKPVTGNIDVTINNSIVYDIFCGGPMVGIMTKPNGESRKTVTTTANNTIFDKFFGGGNGGTSYYREQKFDNDIGWPSNWLDGTYKFTEFNPLNTVSGKNKKYDANKGYHDMFEFEVFNSSNGLNANCVGRTFIQWAQFGTTITGTITNTLTNCTVEHDFYGGGNMGTVDGDVISTLTNTHVKGSVFGAGYSAEIPRFRMHDVNNVHVPTRNNAGLIEEQGYLDYVQDNGEDRYYRWTNDKNNNTASTNAPTYWSEADGEWKCYTPISLEGLGEVHGATTLTIDGTSQIDGNVFGGGDASAVKKKEGVDDSGNTTVILQGKAEVLGNVFGGGNKAPVEGSATVNIQ